MTARVPPGAGPILRRNVAATPESDRAGGALIAKLGMIRARALDFNGPAMSPGYSPASRYAITPGQWGPTP